MRAADCHHRTVSDEPNKRLEDDQVGQAADPAQADGRDTGGTAEPTLAAAVERRRNDPELKAHLQRVRDEDAELLDPMERRLFGV